MTVSLCFRPKSNPVNKFALSMCFFAPPLLPLVLRMACSKYTVCLVSWHWEFWLFHTHPIHLGLFVIVSLVKLGMEVDVLCAGGLELYDSRSWKTGQYALRGRCCHIWCVLCSDCSEVPLWTHSGDFCWGFFFPSRGTFQTNKRQKVLTVLLFKAKQKTRLSFFCCCWSTTFDLCPGKRRKNAVTLGRLLETLRRCLPGRDCSAGGGEEQEEWKDNAYHTLQKISGSTAGSLHSFPHWGMVGIYVFP